MTIFRNQRLKTIAILTLLVLAGSAANAQVKVTDPDENNDIQIIEMTVSAAKQPDPIFTHRLTLLPKDTVNGNAATIYLDALAGSSLSKKWRNLEERFGEDVHSWLYNDMPLDQIPLDELKQASSEFDTLILDYIGRATERRNCDWGLGLEELRGPLTFGLNFNGLQQTRTISRAIALQTRFAIAESRFDDAVDLMRMNYRLAENVGQVKLAVGTLIALAEVGITNGSMVDFIAAADSPNMYWALTELPRPIVDIRGAMRMECDNALRIFPAIGSADVEEHTVDEWSKIVQDMPISAMEVVYRNEDAIRPELRFAALGLGIMSYAGAKQRLIESGMEAEKVEEMAVGQVLLVEAKREYLRYANLMEKEIYLPYPGSAERSDAIEEQMTDPFLTVSGGFGKITASMLLPALEHVRSAHVRLQRDIDALRVIEALRMHAAETGKFPAALSDISVVPIPNNPQTGKPFEYRLDGDTAVIELSRLSGYSKRYRISLR